MSINLFYSRKDNAEISFDYYTRLTSNDKERPSSLTERVTAYVNRFLHFIHKKIDELAKTKPSQSELTERSFAELNTFQSPTQETLQQVIKQAKSEFEQILTSPRSHERILSNCTARLVTNPDRLDDVETMPDALSELGLDV